MCFEGTLSYGEDNPFQGYIDVSLPDGGFDWAYVNEGIISYSASVLEENALDSSRWTFNAYNPRTRQYEALEVPSTLSSSSCNTIQHDFYDPFQCEVTGTLYNSEQTQPLPWQNIIIKHSLGRDYTLSDSNGEYRLSVPCDSITVEAIQQEADGVVTESTSPLIIDFSKENQPPLFSLYREDRNPVMIDDNHL